MRVDLRTGQADRFLDSAALAAAAGFTGIIMNFDAGDSEELLCLYATGSELEVLAADEKRIRVLKPKESPFSIPGWFFANTLKSPQNARHSTIFSSTTLQPT